MAKVRLSGIGKKFGTVEVIRDLNLEVAEGEFCALLGPSGCGKSTLLRMIAGLEDVTEGKIYFDDEDVTEELPTERGIAMVFQSYALYPHMTVEQNYRLCTACCQGTKARSGRENCQGCQSAGAI